MPSLRLGIVISVVTENLEDGSGLLLKLLNCAEFEGAD